MAPHFWAGLRWLFGPWGWAGGCVAEAWLTCGCCSWRTCGHGSILLTCVHVLTQDKGKEKKHKSIHFRLSSNMWGFFSLWCIQSKHMNLFFLSVVQVFTPTCTHKIWRNNYHVNSRIHFQVHYNLGEMRKTRFRRNPISVTAKLNLIREPTGKTVYSVKHWAVSFQTEKKKEEWQRVTDAVNHCCWLNCQRLEGDSDVHAGWKTHLLLTH